MNHRICLLALSLLVPGSPAVAEVYKCRTADGRIEFANVPCSSGANTLKAIREEQVSETARRRAEEEAQRMRELLEQREAEQRAEDEAARAQQKKLADGNAPVRTVEDCLRDLRLIPLQPDQRTAMEAGCRNNPQNPPIFVPVPTPGYGDGSIAGGDPVDFCIRNVERQNLPLTERLRQINACDGKRPKPVAAQPPANAPTGKPPAQPSLTATTAPGLATPPSGAPIVTTSTAAAPTARVLSTKPAACPPGSKDCRTR